MVPISDLSSYNNLMRKSMLDKTFFLSMIDANLYLDYGCADGSTIEFMSNLFPNYHFFGYDNDPEMIKIAKSKNIPNAIFSTDYDELINHNQFKVWKSVLILSSVLHEVHSYLNFNEQALFWKRVTDGTFDYVVIRDMMRIPLREHVNSNIANKIRNHADKKQLFEFESRYGSIDISHNQIHFLLKYTYVDNWERELQEDYMSVDRFDLHAFEDAGYKQTFYQIFNQPHWIKQIKEDFNIDISYHPTHVKCIMEKI